MIHADSLLEEAVFAASTPRINLPADHIRYLKWGYNLRQNGTTAPTYADLVGDVVDGVRIWYGGDLVCDLLNEDIQALNALWGGVPGHKEGPFLVQILTPAGDDQEGSVSPFELPMGYDKTGGKSIQCQFMVGGLTDVDGVELSAHYEFQDGAAQNVQPLDLHYEYQYVDNTFTSAGVFYNIPFDRSGCDLVGLLIWSQTVPIVTAYATTVNDLAIIANGSKVFGPIYWTSMNIGGVATSVGDDANVGALLEHYRFLDFHQGPIPADNLTIQARSDTAVDHGRFIGVFVGKD